MTSPPPLAEQLAAIETGRAYVDLSALRVIGVSGSDARAWLNDLITTDVASLETGQARRSLLLTPTGRIRADFSIGYAGEEFIMLQPEDQPDDIGRLLSPYVLSSAVALEDRTGAVHVLCVISPDALALTNDPDVDITLAPSVIGVGVDIVTAPNSPEPHRPTIVGGLTEVSSDAVDIWRVRNGVPTMGRDFDRGSLPSEAGLDATIDATKGCFLGQESVAKIRNLGHPPTVLLQVRSEGSIPVGAVVFVEGGRRVGQVTSAVPDAEMSTIALARIEWDARSARLTDEHGGVLVPFRTMD
jgi:folate-binding protein YgfZ